MASKLNIELVTVSDELTKKQQRAEYGKLTRAALLDEKRAAITVGCYLAGCKSTFTADELDEWKTWAVEVTRKSYKTCESYLAVGKAYQSSAATIRNTVEGWTFEALQAFASVPADDRKAVVEMVKAEDSNPSPELVRATREIVKDEALTDAERNERAAAKKKRDKQRDEDKTTEMVKAVSPLLNKLTTDADFKAFLLGVEVGIAHKDSELIGKAVKLYRTQKEAAGNVVVKAATKMVEAADKAATAS
jgi:predicted NAD-dependent protein-ADP-ribosyltransferase YbiA (DUF1768 family)